MSSRKYKKYILKNKNIFRGGIKNEIHDDTHYHTGSLFDMFDYNEDNDEEYRSVELLLQPI
jgi:hypothetical protein